MRALKLFVTAWFLTAVAPPEGMAQVHPGGRVRVLTVRGLTLTGTVADFAGDSLYLQSPVTQRWVQQSEIAYLERSTGHYRRFARNLGVTIASTAAFGGLLGAITWKECVETGFLACLMVPESRSEAFAMGAVVGGVLGAPLGVILGLALQYERWEPVQSTGSGGAEISITPTFRRGPGFSASITF